MRVANSPPITTFKELMDEISYDWDSHYTLKKCTNGFCINKLCIEPKYVIYKTDVYELAEGLYEKVEILYQLLQDS